jgi:hypothetical protein
MFPFVAPPPFASEPSSPSPLLDFYREEFLKHLECLHLQRECFSDRAFASAEKALDRILAQLDGLCARHNAGEVVSQLLASFDCVTGVSACCDRKQIH